MSRYDRDPTEFDKDLIIALWHPRYKDKPLHKALSELKTRRHGGTS